MKNYIKHILTFFKIEDGNEVTFILDNGDELKGKIIDSNGWLFINAWTLFNRIGLTDPMKFFKDAVGEENVRTGLWPYVKGKDNLRKILNALCYYRADRIPESEKVVISDDERKPFTLNIKGKKRSTLNFRI